MNRKLRMAMIGGGPDALIGPAHRDAATADGRIELVAGAFSSTRSKSHDFGKTLGLPPKRVYGIYRDLFRREVKLSKSERLDFVSIVTPSNMHYPIAMAALDSGFHVLSESPMTTTVDEAENLARKIKQTEKYFCLTEHVAGYPMVHEARSLIDDGKLGALRRVVVEYPQAWLATRLEAKGQKQAAWRTNPRNVGASGCMSDVASHAINLAAMITGLTLEAVCADLTTFENGRMLDDDGSVLLRYKEGARGVLWASQIAVGETAGMRLRVYGETGGLEWAEAAPYRLTVHALDGSSDTLESSPVPKPHALEPDPMPIRNPKDRVAPLTTLYRNFADTLAAFCDGTPVAPETYAFPTVEAGIRTAHFNAAVVENASETDKWTPVG